MKFILKKSRTGGGGIASSLVSSILSARSHFFSYFSSKFLILKKSFTLVELSIVLLVLALLVSTLLVGRQIIDRAKVQQVVSEIDYYTKNFQMFRDQYDFLPGGLGEETCRKYPEFSMQKGDEPTKYPTQCDDPISMRGGSATKTYTSYQQANFSMVDMVVSGMVENRSPGERRRKKFDIAEKQETSCVQSPAVVGGMYKIKPTDHIGDIDMQFYKTANTFAGFHPASMGSAIRIEVCNTNETTYKSSQNSRTKTGVLCSTPYSSATLIFNVLCDENGNFDPSTYVTDNDGNIQTGTFAGGCGAYYSVNGSIGVNYSFLGIMGSTYVKMSPYGLKRHKGEMEDVCETKTIPGEPRFGYLLKKDEIENQANRASFDSKTYISYSGGKVDYAMIYGIGKENLFQAAENDNVIVFFHFDPDKTEVTDDGAVSYALYDLMVRKLGEKTNSSIGNTIPLNKSAGEGFNFAYIMR